MAKQGMKRPERTHEKPRNEAPPVPELQGRPKTAKEKAKPPSPSGKRTHRAPPPSPA